LDIYIEMIE